MTLDEFAREVGRLVAELRSPVPALKLIGLLGVRAVQRNFQDQRAPDGTPWKPLQHSRERGKLGSAKVLIDTAAMMNGITFDLPSPTSVRIGASSLTSSRNAIHNFGGQAGRGHKVKIPQRRYMGLSDQGKKEILSGVRAQVLRLLKGR